MDTFNLPSLKDAFEQIPLLEEQEGELSEGQRLKAINKPLISWFEKYSRDLPWRRNPSPYQVWISEIMLQQTRVEAVKPYYQRFIKKYPDIAALAKAKEDELFKLWEGLGYYSRARNLRAAAIRLCDEYQGQLPQSYELLLQLPGIGNYTAGAIASLAFGIPVPAVDGNAMRVVSRLLGSREEVSRQQTKKRFAALLAESMDKGNPGAFNQGLFEVGALVCIPKGKPRCGACPLSSLCITKQKELWGEIPVKTAKKARRIEERTVLVISNGREVALRRRPDQGLLASLYEFPNVEGRLLLESPRQAEKRLGLERDKVQAVFPLGEARHIFSHVEWKMVGYRIEVKGELPGECICAAICELEEKYSIPSAFLAYKKALF